MAKEKHKIDDVFRYLPNHNKVLHVGGHLGQEAEYYNDVVYVEPMPQYAEELRRRGFKVIEGAVGGNELYVTDYDQASSVCEPKVHKIVKKIKVKQYDLRDIEHGFDVLVLDIQGAELLALKTSNLKFNYIILEASNTPRYVYSPTKQQIEEYLRTKGFRKIAEFQHKGHDIWDIVFKSEDLMGGGHVVAKT